MRFCWLSPPTSATTSMMLALMSNRSLRGGDLLTKVLIRLMTTLARLPSLTMRSTDRRAASRFGGSAVSQREAAFPLLTTLASGGLTS